MRGEAGAIHRGDGIERPVGAAQGKLAALQPIDVGVAAAKGGRAAVALSGDDLAARVGSLTPSQLRILEGLKAGRLNKQIAFDLGIAEGSLTPQADTSLIVDTLIAQIDGFDLAIAAGREGLTPDQISVTLEATAAALLRVDSTAVTRRP